MLRMEAEEAGFSIVELLITLIIIGIVFSSFALSFTSIQSINKKAMDITYANTIAFAKIQEYENKTFSAITATTPTGSLVQIEDFSSSLSNSLESPRVGKVYVNTVSSTLKQIVVNITFGSGNKLRQVQYADFIQSTGLGR